MPKKRRDVTPSRVRERRALAVLGLALAAFWLAAFGSYLPEPAAGSPEAPPMRNVCGSAGARLTTFSMALLGWPAALALILALGSSSLLGTLGRSPWRRPVPLLCGIVLLVPPLLVLAGTDRFGGAYGRTVAGALNAVFGSVGAWIVVIGIALAVFLVTSDRRIAILPPLRSLSGAARSAGRAASALGRGARELAEVVIRRRGDEPPFEPLPPDAEEPPPIRVARDLDREPLASVSRGGQAARGLPEPGLEDPFRSPTPSIGRAPRREVRREGDARKRPASAYAPPPLSLLADPPGAERTVSRRALAELGETLRRTLEEFGIGGRVDEVHPGPVITRYDFEPAPGVKVTQIVSREDDIALALRTDRIRILPRVPGKAAVGIEIPNESPDLIHFKEILASRAYRESTGVLSLVLGKNAAGRPFVDHLEAMPHLLVAGTTGSGKSVCVNTIIASLLFRHRPEDLRLMLIDPKMLELTAYDGIPHLALPVVTESKDASKALQWLVREMERRYRILAARSARNIATYHARFFADPEGAPKVPDGEEPPERMPYLVCVVDELADLMMQHAAEVETPIARLAQMARAVGIHLILATQRPSVDVITGVIKANFPARIAFQVATRTDSRTILDQNGAESLIGRGDMLYQPSGRPTPIRLHGAFLPDPDIEALVSYLGGFAATEAPIEFETQGGAGGALDADADPLLGDAARTVVLQGQASTSLLQRRLKVGYARAGRLMDQLEQGGIVGAFEGSKPREVLVDMNELEERGLV